MDKQPYKTLIILTVLMPLYFSKQILLLILLFGLGQFLKLPLYFFSANSMVLRCSIGLLVQTQLFSAIPGQGEN